MAQQGTAQKSASNRGFDSMNDEKKQNPKAGEQPNETRQAGVKSEGSWQSGSDTKTEKRSEEMEEDDEQADLGNRASQSQSRDEQAK